MAPAGVTFVTATVRELRAIRTATTAAGALWFLYDFRGRKMI